MFNLLEAVLEKYFNQENTAGRWLELPHLDVPLFSKIQRGDHSEHLTQDHPLLCIQTGFFNNYNDNGTSVDFQPIVYVTLYEISMDDYETARQVLNDRLWYDKPDGTSRGVMPSLLQRPFPRDEAGNPYMFKILGPPTLGYRDTEGYYSVAARIPILAETYRGIPRLR